MVFNRSLWAICLLLNVLQSSSGIALESGCSPVVLDVSMDRYNLLKEKAAGDVSLLLSIPVEGRTFENFVLPWCRLKYQIRFASCDAQHNRELFGQIMREIDPCDFLLTAIKGVSERQCGNASLNMYQKYLLQKIRSELDGEQDLLFFDEDALQSQGVKGDAAVNRILSLFNCAIPLCDADAFEETIASIAETEADVVCVHDIANEEVRYRIYEVLREQYGYFCLEIGDNGGALIASKYRLGNEKNAFFDDNGVFFEIRVFDGCKEIGRIVLARPNRALFSEQLASAVEQVTEMIQIGLLQLPEPILFCGNFPRSNPPSEAFGTLLTEYFENDGADNEAICSFLLSSSLFFQTITGIPLAMDSQGLLSVISICDVNLYLEAPNSGRYLLKCDVSGSAGYDCASSSSYADVSIGTAGDGWSASVHGDVHRDSSGQTSGGARVEFSGTW